MMTELPDAKFRCSQFDGSSPMSSFSKSSIKSTFPLAIPQKTKKVRPNKIALNSNILAFTSFLTPVCATLSKRSIDNTHSKARKLDNPNFCLMIAHFFSQEKPFLCVFVLENATILLLLSNSIVAGSMAVSGKEGGIRRDAFLPTDFH